MKFVNLVQQQIAMTTEDTERAAGFRQGLSESLSLMLQAAVDDHQKG
jgi:hypothetical protein